MNTIFLKYPDHTKFHLAIGDGGIFKKPHIVTTVLGSCVSVTFFCPAKKIGAVFHAVLPSAPGKEYLKPLKNPFQYVDASITHILQLFNGRGIQNNQLEAKLFGGSQVILNESVKTGANNIMTAYEMLAANNIKIIASDVGGDKGRKLVFISDTGEVYVKNHKKNVISPKQWNDKTVGEAELPKPDGLCGVI